MEILYTSNICSENEFKRIYDMCDIKPMQSIQKFNTLLCKGLSERNKINLSILTGIPVNRKMCKKIWWKYKKEKESNIIYYYAFMINLPIIKFVTLFFSTIYITTKWCIMNRKQDKAIIYDAFCPIIGNFSALIGKIFKVKVIALYTDVPKCMLDNLENKSYIKKFLKKMYNLLEIISNKLSDKYILLTEQMNEVVNRQHKPYTVIEGIVDDNKNFENKLENKNEYFTLLYAGGLYKKFGIENLVKAVETINDENIRLILYGSGEMECELIEKYSENKKIQYKKTAPNEEIVKEEIKATVLVNPRFTNEEYTKYSFPSKNMEYMASGTPVLTTRLPGIPVEYNRFVYFIENETIQGIKKSIEGLMNKSKNELHQKGLQAQEFVLVNKNKTKQSEKILKLLEDEI